MTGVLFAESQRNIVQTEESMKRFLATPLAVVMVMIVAISTAVCKVEGQPAFVTDQVSKVEKRYLDLPGFQGPIAWGKGQLFQIPFIWFVWLNRDGLITIDLNTVSQATLEQIYEVGDASGRQWKARRGKSGTFLETTDEWDIYYEGGKIFQQKEANLFFREIVVPLINHVLQGGIRVIQHLQP